MTYSMETSATNDSDTFESQRSCPVCYIPDNYNNVLYIFRKNGYTVRAIQLATVLGLGYWGWRTWKNIK